MIIRKTLDTDVALASLLKRRSSKAPFDESEGLPLAHSASQIASAAHSDEQASTTTDSSNGSPAALAVHAPLKSSGPHAERPQRPLWKRAIKIALYPFYRLSVLVARPVMARLRGFLLNELRQDIINHIMDQSIATRNVLREEVINVSRRLDESNAKLSHLTTQFESIAPSVMESFTSIARTHHAEAMRRVDTVRMSVTETSKDRQADIAAVKGGLQGIMSINEDVLKRVEESSQGRQADIAVVRDTMISGLQGIMAAFEAAQKDDVTRNEGVLHWVEETSQDRHADITAVKDVLLEKLEGLSAVTSRLGIIENYAYLSARRVNIPFSDGSVMVRTTVGYVMCDVEDFALIAILAEKGELETGTRLIIERVLESGDTFIDVGANIGMHTVAAARIVGGDGQIVAVEPFERTSDLLKKTIWLNGFADFVNVENMAIGTGAAEQKFFLGQSSSHHSLHPLEGTVSNPFDNVMVKVAGLDSLTLELGSIALIKIDVEGAELEVLETAQRTLESNPDIAVIAEFGPAHLKRYDASTEHWFERFEAYGFVAKAIDEDNGRLIELNTLDLNQTASVNIFFARPNSAVWRKFE